MDNTKKVTPVSLDYIRSEFPEAAAHIEREYKGTPEETHQEDYFWVSEAGLLHWVTPLQGDWYWDGEHETWVLTDS